MKKDVKIGFYKLIKGGYQVSFIDATGKRVRTKYKSYRDAKAKLLLLESSFLNPKREFSVSDLLKEYISNNPTSLPIKRTPQLIDSFKKYFELIKAKNLTKIDCAAWLVIIKKEKKYSSRTMLQCKYAFTPFFNYLVNEKIINKNHMAEVYVKKGTRVKSRTFLSEPELIKLLDDLKRISPKGTYPVTYFLIHTGCRIDEALSLTWKQLNFEKQSVYFPTKPNSSERTLNLPPQLMKVLTEQSRTIEFVFLNAQGDAWKVQSYYRQMSLDRTTIGLPRSWNNFTFRHTFAYHFLRKGRGIHQLQAVLGHRYISQTIAAYGDIVSKSEERTSPYTNRENPEK